MNRRDFLRGCTALVTAAALPAPAKAKCGMAIMMDSGPRTIDPVYDLITRRALEIMEASLRPIIERYADDLMTYGTQRSFAGQIIRFRRPEPYAPTERELHFFGSGAVERRLVTKAELKHYEETGTWP